MFLTATSCIHLSSDRSVVSTKQNAWLCDSDYHIIQKRGQEGILIRGSTIYIPSLPVHSITRQKKATSTLNNPFSKQSFLFMITIHKQHTDCYRMNVDVTYPAETVVSLTDYNPPCATHWDSSQAWGCAPGEEEPVLSKLCYVCPSTVNRESEEGKTSFTWCSLKYV